MYSYRQFRKFLKIEHVTFLETLKVEVTKQALTKILTHWAEYEGCSVINLKFVRNSKLWFRVKWKNYKFNQNVPIFKLFVLILTYLGYKMTRPSEQPWKKNVRYRPNSFVEIKKKKKNFEVLKASCRTLS